MTQGMHAELAHARARARTRAVEAGELLDVCCFLQLNPFFVPPTLFRFFTVQEITCDSRVSCRTLNVDFAKDKSFFGIYSV